MSQHDFDLANAAGASFRADANLALGALVSNSSGTTAPATTFAYQWWADTTTGLMKIRNAANSAWITIGPIAAGVLNEVRADIAMHATTMDLFAFAVARILDGTGSAVVITAIVNAPQAGARRTLYPITGTTITNGATFAVDGAANYVTAAGDALEFEAITTSTYKVHITRNEVMVSRTSTDTLTNKTLTAPVLSGTATGTYSLGGTPTLASPLSLGAGQYFNASSTAAGTAIWYVTDGNNRSSIVAFAGVDTTAYNAANTAMAVQQAGGTGRSINAAGTINAGGADYAEYETKRDDCGTIAKGQIVGFDADGLLTDQWSLAVTFGVKSTAPSYVGGDVWFNEERIQPPVEPERLEDSADEDWALIEAANADGMAAWEKVNTDFNARLEVARQKVDRIAYSGKVPVNVTGAIPGQWIVPAQAGTGIKGVVSDGPTGAVGRVRKILPDGRAQIAVIIG